MQCPLLSLSRNFYLFARINKTIEFLFMWFISSSCVRNSISLLNHKIIFYVKGLSFKVERGILLFIYHHYYYYLLFCFLELLLIIMAVIDYFTHFVWLFKYELMYAKLSHTSSYYVTWYTIQWYSQNLEDIGSNFKILWILTDPLYKYP